MNHLMDCRFCKKKFRAFRNDAKFCSNSCRVSYHQLPVKFSEKAGGSFGYMCEIENLSKRFPEKIEEAEKQLAWLRQQLNRIDERVADLRGKQVQG